VKIRIDTRTLTPDGFGIEVSGFDMSQFDDQSGQVLTQAFLDHGGLLVLRDQTLETPNDLCQFTALFGEVEHNEKYDPRYLLPDYPEILRIGNTMENGQYNALFIRADPSPLLWHCDDSFRHPQPMGSCLLRTGTSVRCRDRLCWDGSCLRRLE
jgi:alpha-ketoglutarate-dependent taurine dioxygenase